MCFFSPSFELACYLEKEPRPAFTGSWVRLASEGISPTMFTAFMFRRADIAGDWVMEWSGAMHHGNAFIRGPGADYLSGA